MLFGRKSFYWMSRVEYHSAVVRFLPEFDQCWMSFFQITCAECHSLECHIAEYISDYYHSAPEYHPDTYCTAESRINSAEHQSTECYSADCHFDTCCTAKFCSKSVIQLSVPSP